jgi:uncharacterized SAM-binding protein YcdF (DUF218 family)
VPSEAIELGSASRNTYENALEIKQMWEGKGLKTALLVTSAVHMPRLATFRRVILPVTASTADVQYVDGNVTVPLLAWLPDASALALTTSAAKEWIGLLVYGLSGFAASFSLCRDFHSALFLPTNRFLLPVPPSPATV